MDFFQVIKDRNQITNQTETTEYIAGTTRVQYTNNVYEYDENNAIRYDDVTNDTPRNRFVISEESTLASTENPDEEPYDYEKFKLEYEQQIEYNMRHGKAFNYTEKKELEGSPKETLKRILDLKRPKNCTKKELSQIGIKALKCIVHEYQSIKTVAAARTVLFKTWLVVKIWLLIYICLAIPCWCYGGNFINYSARVYFQF